MQYKIEVIVEPRFDEMQACSLNPRRSNNQNKGSSRSIGKRKIQTYVCPWL